MTASDIIDEKSHNQCIQGTLRAPDAKR